ncbi:MAG: cation:proton antiporter [Mycobacterium sp.]|nr:cation:proton antiporter [Mycobacterium sp.]
MIADLTVIGVAAVVAPVLAEVSGRLAIPGVVIEIVLGILIGPEVLGWASTSDIVDTFSNFGLSLLMFLAGYELDLALLRGRPLALAGMSWAYSLVLAAGVGLVILLSGAKHGEIVTGLALSTTALGTLLPVLRDSGVFETPFGRHILAVGSVGEFGPIVLVALVLSGKNPGITGILLLAFALLAAGSALAASRPWGRRINGLVRRGLHSSSQLPVRLAMLLTVSMVLLASHLGLDVLLGAFAAGMVVRAAVGGRDDDPDTRIYRGKLEAIGFGFLVPIFFIVSGMKLNLSTFGRHPGALALIPLFFVLLLIVRGVPVYFVYRKVVAPAETLPLALFASTGLPLIVVITTLGLADGYVTSQTAAALVTAGMLSVLFLPAVGLSLLRRGSEASSSKT